VTLLDSPTLSAQCWDEHVHIEGGYSVSGLGAGRDYRAAHQFSRPACADSDLDHISSHVLGYTFKTIASACSFLSEVTHI
jgi:hypothetical protein